MSEELYYRIALTLLPNVGPVSAKALIGYCGGVKEVFEAKPSDILSIPGIGPSVKDTIARKDVFDLAEREVKFIEKEGIKPIFFLDPNYPKRLTQEADSPVMLYMRGEADLNAPRMVGVVGTREATQMGLANTEALVEFLEEYHVTFVSGLAFGIDAAMHKKASQLGISNIACVAHGLDAIYPAEHRSLAKEIEKCGAILTEFPTKTRPDRERFPMRNRIIAGLSDALVVVETANSGGSMITADMAFGYNKDVFAFPGRPTDVYSGGCNVLIKRTKAGLIENGQDLVDQMMWQQLDEKKNIQTSLFVDLNEDEQVVVQLLRTKGETSFDQLYTMLKLSPSEMAALLLGLEFKGMIRPIPGKQYILV